MNLKTIALVVVGLWAFKRMGHAHAIAQQSVEIIPADPYGGIGDLWGVLNGGLYDYNAHAPLIATVGDGQAMATPCVCR